MQRVWLNTEQLWEIGLWTFIANCVLYISLRLSKHAGLWYGLSCLCNVCPELQNAFLHLKRISIRILLIDKQFLEFNDEHMVVEQWFARPWIYRPKIGRASFKLHER